MRRPAEERLRTIHVWRTHLALYYGSSDAQPPERDLQPGGFRKARRVGGCGHSHCYVCHPSKLTGLPSSQEERSWLAFRDQLTELGLVHFVHR